MEHFLGYQHSKTAVFLRLRFELIFQHLKNIPGNMSTLADRSEHSSGQTYTSLLDKILLLHPPKQQRAIAVPQYIMMSPT